MELKLVSFELAKKLKEVGFNIILKSLYYTKDKESSTWNSPHDFNSGEIRGDGVVSSPELELAKMWFRKKHEIEVRSEPNASGWFWMIEKTNGTFISDYNDSGKNAGGCWDSYEEALEASLLEACKLIK